MFSSSDILLIKDFLQTTCVVHTYISSTDKFRQEIRLHN